VTKHPFEVEILVFCSGQISSDKAQQEQYDEYAKNLEANLSNFQGKSMLSNDGVFSNDVMRSELGSPTFSLLNLRSSA